MTTTCQRNGTTYVLKPAYAICQGCVAESPTSEPTKLCIELGACMTCNGTPFEGIWVETDEVPVTEGELSLYRWQYHRAGDFEQKLWEAITQADSTNLGKLELGFPEHVEAYRRYSYERGYWDVLRARIEQKGE